jgi:hypothetical protein
MLTNIEDAQHEFQVSLEEAAADSGMEADTIAGDILFATAMNCDQATAYELSRIELGWVTDEVKRFFAPPSMPRVEKPEPWLWDVK